MGSVCGEGAMHAAFGEHVNSNETFASPSSFVPPLETLLPSQRRPPVTFPHNVQREGKSPLATPRNLLSSHPASFR